jgi:hypothetical protein
MPDTLPDLWPEIEMENVVTPLAILRFQAGQLRAKTKGLIEAEVRTDQTEFGWMRHHLVLIAPALERYEYEIATFQHSLTFVYPVDVLAADDHQRECNSQGELLEAVSAVLRSEKVRSVISSLIAQSRDASSLANSSGAK